MENYGFSDQEVATLVVTKDACVTLENQTILVEQLNDRLCKIDNVAILSRLGADVFLSTQNKRISLPKNLVVSWSVPALANQKAGPNLKH